MPGVSVEAPRYGVSIVTIHCRLLCYDLDCGAEFFGDDLASYRNSSICFSPHEISSEQLKATKLQSSNFVYRLATRTTNFHMTNCHPNGHG